MNKKGFTLVELLVSIVIMMLILFMVLPAINSLQNNNKNRPYEMYGESLIEAAKLYVVKEGEDLTDLGTTNWSGCIDITYQNLIDSKLIKPYGEEGIDCSNSTVRYTRENGSDSYQYSMTCTEDGSKEVYSSPQISGTCSQKSEDVAEPEMTFANYLLTYQTNSDILTDYEKASSAEKRKLFVFKHEATEQTGALTDYRYIGDNPYNYVNLYGELWRIVGVFPTEDENGSIKNKIKLVRNTGIGSYSWDSSASSVNAGRGINEWSQSDVNTLLNTTYYNKTNGTCYNGENDTNTACDFTSIGFTENIYTVISNSKYYLGSLTEGMTMNASGLYARERSNTKIASPADGITRTTNSLAKVGLLYPSDYAYTFANGIDNTCYSSFNQCDKGSPTKSWLYNSNFDNIMTDVDTTATNTITKQGTWLMTSSNKEASAGSIITATGKIDSSTSYDSNAFSIRPVVYLNDDVRRDKGTGSRTDPYVFNTIRPTCTITVEGTKPKPNSNWYKTATAKVVANTNGGSDIVNTVITDSVNSDANTIEITKEGSTLVSATVTNEFGYSDICSATINKDSVAPSIPIVRGYSWNSNSDTNPTSSSNLAPISNGRWTNKNIFTMPYGDMRDVTSGFSHYEVMVRGAGKELTDEPVEYRNIKSEGTTKIYYRACDKAGNCSAYSNPFVYKRDTKPPYLSLNSKCYDKYNDGTYCSGSSKYPAGLRVSFKDSGSGIYSGNASYPRGYIDDYGTTICTGTLSFKVQEGVTENLCGCRGTYKFVNVCDNVGNCFSKSFSITGSSPCKEFNKYVEDQDK